MSKGVFRLLSWKSDPQVTSPLSIVHELLFKIKNDSGSLCQESKTEKGRSKVSVSKAASRVVVQVYHTGQGQDERARPRPAHLLRGLDSAWSESSNPHRESGTRCRAAADVGGTGTSAGTAHGRQSRRIGNRLGDSVGAHSPRTGAGPRSAERTHWGVMGRRYLDSGGVWPGRMRPLCRFKRRGLIAGVTHPHTIDDAPPDVGQSAQRNTTGFAFCQLALIVRSGPWLAQGRLPGKLVEIIAPRFDAGKALVCPGIVAALERHRSRASQFLNTLCISIARPIVSPFGEQTWSQALACTRQGTPDLMIWMGQKKGLNLLLIAGNVLDHDQQLFDQRQHQARFGPHRDGGGFQLRTMHFLNDRSSGLSGVGKLSLTQGGRDLFHRRACCGLWSRVGSQKPQRGRLVQLGEQRNSNRIGFLEARGQLITK